MRPLVFVSVGGGSTYAHANYCYKLHVYVAIFPHGEVIAFVVVAVTLVVQLHRHVLFNV